MITRALGFLLIVKALSPFLWLLVGYLIVMQISDRFGAVSGGYSRDITIRVEAFGDLADRFDEQIKAIAPLVQTHAEIVAERFAQLQSWIAFNIEQIGNLPEIDLSNVMPELRLPQIRLFPIDLDWDIPNFPIVRELATAVRNGLQKLMTAVNTTFSSFATAIKTAFDAALEPMKEQFHANVMAQIQPYLDAYANVKWTMGLAEGFVDDVMWRLGLIEAAIMERADILEDIANDLEDQIGLSIEMVDTAPENLDRAIADSAWLLLLFGIFTLGLFLVFYWARMMTDLLRGWQLMLGRYDDWRKQQDAEPKQPLFDRLAEKLEEAKRSKAAAR